MINNYDIHTWLSGYLHALECRKRMGMTEEKRRNYLYDLEEVIDELDGIERDRVRREIMLLRGWECNE